MASSSPSSTSSPPTSSVTFNAFAGHFVKDGRPLPGMLGFIQARFYPRYSHLKATFNRSDPDQTEYKQRKSSKAKFRVRKKGTDLGIQLDKEITDTIRVLETFAEVTPQVFFDKDACDRARMAPWGKAICVGLLPQTRAFWFEISKYKLLPLRSQVIVDAGWFATAIDVECINLDGNYVLLEVKCGFEGYYHMCTSRKMEPPFQNMNDSPANQHQIQLAAQREMYLKQHPDRPLVAGYVMRIQNTKVKFYSLQPWVTRVPSIVALLSPELKPTGTHRKRKSTSGTEQEKKKIKLE